MYSQEYLESLIEDKKEEDLNLEYKSSASLSRSDQKKVNEISKDVSAFANANGGIIIYGIAENQHLPERIDYVDRSLVDREWLEQKIQDTIRPKIEGIVIHPIMIDDDTNKVVYLVEIPQSTTGHQASDKKYYKRHNFNVLAMYDYEIRDVFNRVKTPKIEVIIELKKFTYEVKPPIGQFSFQINRDLESKKNYSTTNTLTILGKNIGGVFVNYVNCFIEIPVSILREKQYDYIDTYLKNEIEYKKLFCDNTIREIKDTENYGLFTTHKYWPSRYDPILPETQLRFDEIKLKNDFAFDNEEIFWEVYADNSAKRKGSLIMSEIKIIDKQKEE